MKAMYFYIIKTSYCIMLKAFSAQHIFYKNVYEI